MKLLFSILLLTSCLEAIAQNKSSSGIDSTNFKKIYPLALRGEMKPLFKLLTTANNASLTKKQIEKKERYFQRFLFLNEDFNYNTNDQEIMDLYKRFQNYWRSVLIENVKQELADSLFRIEMQHFLKKHFKPKSSIEEISKNYFALFQDFFRKKNMFGLAMGKTGHLYDLYLWKKQEEKNYSIDLPEGQTIDVPVVFMKDFISNGWSHYTTFGYSYSGGWVAPNKLFCVEEAYGSKDEEAFLVSYVSHEAQHFSDIKRFPKLQQADLEYRAKLAELILSKETSYNIINKFILNSKKDISFAHAFANYMVISLLSKSILKSDFESSIKKWKQIHTNKINTEALKLLKAHTKKLNNLGADSVKAYITTL